MTSSRSPPRCRLLERSTRSRVRSSAGRSRRHAATGGGKSKDSQMPRMEASIGSVSCRPLPVTIDTQSSIAREVWPPRRQGRFMCATAPAVVPFESTRRTHGILSGKGQASTTSSMERQRTGSWAGAMIGSSSQASSGSID